jgi:MFS transporter, DHA1 family, tetracycline resistance protein
LVSGFLVHAGAGGKCKSAARRTLEAAWCGSECCRLALAAQSLTIKNGGLDVRVLMQRSAVQAVLMHPLLMLAGEKGTLVVSQIASFLKWLGIAAAMRKWQVFAFEASGAFAFLALPTISSIKANAVRDHEQGALQGALTGVSALAAGAGPLLFMQLFHFCTSATLWQPRVRFPRTVLHNDQLHKPVRGR